jgi:hypothetical protein
MARFTVVPDPLLWRPRTILWQFTTWALPVLAGAGAPAGASFSGIPDESCKITR